MPSRAYFDTSYLLKSYVTEEGSAAVRDVLTTFDDVACSSLGRAEIASGLQRAFRERRLGQGALRSALGQWRADEAVRAWEWLPVTESILDEAFRRLVELPRDRPLRAGDAIHLATARAHGFTQIWSGDLRLLGGAQFFDLEPRSV